MLWNKHRACYGVIIEHAMEQSWSMLWNNHGACYGAIIEYTIDYTMEHAMERRLLQ